MATYYDRFTGDINCGSYLDVLNVSTNAESVVTSIAGGWHTYVGPWSVSGIYCSLGYIENGVSHSLANDTGFSFSGSGDKEFMSVASPFARQASERTITLYCYLRASINGSTREAQAEYTFGVPHLPGAPTSLTATRISDNRIDLSWTNPSLDYGGFYLQVSIDGGSWSNAWSVENVMPTSYSYTQASAGHSYKFRAYTGHWYASSAYSNETATISMTPSAPQSISVAASGGTNVTVTLANDSAVATSLEYQTSTDGGSTWSASTTVSGSPVTSFSTSVSGTALIRVRNKNATGVSDWLVSDPITTICPPAPPTLRTPSGSVYDMALGDIEFSWLHNSLDGSAQSAYELRYAINGGAWTTLSGTTAQSRTVSIVTFTAGDSVTWQVRTKGADANYSDWSQTGAFSVYTAPTVSITSPGATITGMPISLTATYSDMAGFTCQAATVSLTKDGRTLYSEAATINGTSITSSLDVSEFLPTNGESYTVVLTARSSSSLQTTANATFLVDFTEPAEGELNITNDPETGYASLLATFDNSASEITYSGDTNAQYESTEGYVRSLTVEGKSAKWNQQVVDGNFTGTVSGAWVYAGSSAGSTLSFSGGVAKLVINDNQGNARPNLTNHPARDVVTGHKLFFHVECRFTSSISGLTLTFRPLIGTEAIEKRITADGQWTESEGIGTISNTSQKNRTLYVTSQFTAFAVGDSLEYRNYMVIDLTAIYGSGNEPTSLDDPRIAWLKAYALAHPDYDAGSLVSIEGVSVGDGTIETPLRSAGSVHDTLMADADSWTVRRKIGVVDLGSLTWTVRNGVGMQTGGLSSLIKSPSANDQLPNVVMPNATPMTWTTLVNSGTSSGGVGVSGGYLAISTTETDTAAFKTAMSGVYLFYELATPTQDTETSMDTIEIGSAFTVATDLDSTFEMTTWDGSADAVSISVSRVNADGTITPLLTDGASGSGLVDKYAPLNTPYQYAVTTKAFSQAVRTVYVDNIIESDYWFAYWGDNVAKAKWNPDNGGIQITRPSKTRVYYAGRRDPVSYDGHAVALTETPSWMFIGKDEVDAFVKLIEDGGRGIYKSCDGWVYHADFDLTLTPSYTAIGYYGGASLGITRIAGDRL